VAQYDSPERHPWWRTSTAQELHHATAHHATSHTAELTFHQVPVRPLLAPVEKIFAIRRESQAFTVIVRYIRRFTSYGFF